MSVRSRTFRLFVGIYAQELVDAIYRGALARPADPATRQRCAALLSKSPALSEVLGLPLILPNFATGVWQTLPLNSSMLSSGACWSATRNRTPGPPTASSLPARA